MITIRKATTADAAQIEKLYTELEQDAVRYQPEHFVFSPAGARSKQLEAIIASDNQVMFVAQDDGNVIGFAHVTYNKAKDISCLKPQSNIYLQDLVVKAECRSWVPIPRLRHSAFTTKS